MLRDGKMDRGRKPHWRPGLRVAKLIGHPANILACVKCKGRPRVTRVVDAKRMHSERLRASTLRSHRRQGGGELQPPTDPSPLRGAPVPPLEPVPDMAKGAPWAFEIPIRRTRSVHFSGSTHCPKRIPMHLGVAPSVDCGAAPCGRY